MGAMNTTYVQFDPVQMIAYIMNLVYNDRLRTGHDDMQTGKIDKQ